MKLNRYCSPSKHYKLDTCYNKIELIAMINAYNKFNNKLKIDINGKSYDDLYKEFKLRLKTRCSNKKTAEMCWIEQDFIKKIPDENIKESIMHFTFKPKGTINNKSWFNTNNINEIMQQYEYLYKDTFKFLGAQPSDFSKIAQIKWKELKKIKSIGIIFNTDNHIQPGKHWVSVFIDNKNKTVEYFDSLGKMPNKNIASFLKHFSNYSFIINKKNHQKGNNNCGVYSCYFLIQRLKGITFEQITKNIITDKSMTDYRSFLFRPHN